MFNNALLMAAAASGDSLVQVGNSALFDASASTDGLSYTTDGSGFNQQTFTLSTWFYLGSNTASIGGVGWPIFASDHGSANSETTWWKVRINTNGTLVISNWNDVTTTQVFRDIGWYNLVIAADTTQAIASNRYRVYVNGERITSFSSTGYPSQNIDLAWGEPSEDHWIGNYDNANYAYNGYLAETVFKSGSQLGPESFGEFDSTGTFWTPLSSTAILASSPTFYLDNATNPQTDASGNGNNFTNNGSIALSTHTPTNINTLMNPLSMFQSMSLANGNNKVTFTAATYTGNIFTIPIPPTGKWKMEVDMTAITGGLIRMGIIEKTEYSPKNMATNIPFDHSSLGNPDFNTISTSGGNASAIGRVDGTDYNFASEANGSRVVSNGDRWALYYDADSGKFWAANDDGSGDTTYFYEDSGGTAGNPATGSNPLATSNTSKSYQFYVTGYSDPTANRNFLFKEEADWILTTPTGYAPLTTTNIAAEITRTKSNLEEYFDSILYEGNGAGQRVGKFLPFTDTFTVGNSGLFKLVSTSQNTSNPRLTRTQAAGASNKKFCFSFWFKRGLINNTSQYVYSDVPTDGLYSGIYINSSNQVEIFTFLNGSTIYRAATTRVITDTSQWNHVVINIDTSQSTAADRQEIYLNGVDQPLTISNQIPQDSTRFTIGDADIPIGIGSFISNSSPRLPFDGYLAEYVYINDVNLAASSFGQVDTSSGRWIPKSLSGLSFDSTGFYLNFATLGDDVSGNNNDFTNANVVQVADTPTTNFGTLNTTGGGVTLSNGNRTNTGSANLYTNARTSLTFGNEKIFAMLLINDGGSGASVNTGFSIAPDSYVPDGNNAGQTGAYANIQTQGTITRVIIGDAKGGTVLVLTHSIAIADGDYFTMAVDAANGAVWFGIYDTSAGSHQYLPAVVGGTAGDPANGTLPTVSNLPFNNSQSCIFSTGYSAASSSTILFNSADMPMSLPTDYLEFKQDNLTTGESYQTAFSWIKNRDATDNHMLFDRVRGIYNDMHSNTTDIQVTNVNTLQRFLNGGVQVGNDVQVNTASESYVAWNWYMETTGSGSSNTDGTINTTSTLVDTNLGLSISTYTGTGANATVGHGLGVAPEIIFVKRTDSASGWYMQHSNLLATQFMQLNATDAAAANATVWNSTFPTSTVFNIGSNAVTNASSATYLALCFAPSQFTSIGSYTGNGNADGTFIPTVNSLGIPIQPAWFMAKSTGSGQDWRVVDNKRSPFNVNSLHLRPNTTAADVSETNLDIDTGGIKIRTSSGGWNTSGTEYIYLAFGTPLIDVDGRIITGF